MYVFAGVRARVFAFDGPAPAGGGGGYSEDWLPSLLSSLPPSLLQPLGRATSRLVPSQLERRRWQLLQQT